MTFALGLRSNDRLALVHPRMARVVRAAITLSAQDFCVNDGARTAEEQHAIFLAGHSQKDGYKAKSNHQVTADGYGHAVDLVPCVNGKPIWDDTWALHYPVAVAMSQAARALAIRIRWGGNWYEPMDAYASDLAGVKAAVERYKIKHPGPDFLDAPHFELAA